MTRERWTYAAACVAMAAITVSAMIKGNAWLAALAGCAVGVNLFAAFGPNRD